MVIYTYAWILLFFFFSNPLGMAYDNGNVLTDKNQNIDHEKIVDKFISIDDALDLAIASHPKIQSVAADVNREKALWEAEKNNWHPTIYLEANRSEKDPSSDDDSKQRYGVSLQQDLIFSKMGIERSIAFEKYQLQNINYKNEKQSIALGVAIIYIEALRNRELLMLIREYREHLENLKLIYKKREQMGVDSKIPSKILDISIKQNTSEHDLLETNMNDNLFLLAVNTSVPEIKPGTLVAMNIKVFNQSNKRLLELALQQNYSLQQAKIAVKNVQLSAKRKNWDLYPDFLIDTFVLNNHDFNGKQTIESSINIRLKWKLWDGGKIKNELFAKKYELKAAQENFKERELTIRNEFKKFMSSYKTSLSENRSAMIARDSAIDLVELQKLNFIDFSDSMIIQIQTTLREWHHSAKRVIDSKFNALINYYRIKALVGEI